MKPAGSAFVKEYSYTIDEGQEERRPYSPRDHGFTYTGSREGGISPISPQEDLPSPTSKRLTALAFTYKPPESEKTKSPTSPTKSKRETKPPQQVKSIKTTAKETLIDDVYDERATQEKTKTFATAKQSKVPGKETPILVKTDVKVREAQRSKLPISTSPKTPSETGRTSRQSKDSKLESSSSSSVSSSGSSMVDEYERESLKQDISLTRPAETSPKSYEPFKRQIASEKRIRETKETKKEKHEKTHSITTRKPRETQLTQLSEPKITHVSRKRVVTNADGSVEEVEEILDPSQARITKPASKPVVVGVVPSTGKPKPDSVLTTSPAH